MASQSEELDVVDDRDNRAFLGITQLAASVAGAKWVDGDERELARRILARGAADQILLEPRQRECEGIAATFNRQMDVLIDGANASSMKRTRATRRALMAQALDAGDLILLDKSIVAGLFGDSVELQLMQPQLAALNVQLAAMTAQLAEIDRYGVDGPYDPPEPIAAEIAAAGGCCSNPDYFDGDGSGHNPNVND